MTEAGGSRGPLGREKGGLLQLRWQRYNRFLTPASGWRADKERTAAVPLAVRVGGWEHFCKKIFKPPRWEKGVVSRLIV